MKRDAHHPKFDTNYSYKNEKTVWSRGSSSDTPVQEGTDVECDHNCEWDHWFDEDSSLGDYYTCTRCGELTQVG